MSWKKGYPAGENPFGGITDPPGDCPDEERHPLPLILISSGSRRSVISVTKPSVPSSMNGVKSANPEKGLRKK
jgi:hypothetical protein